MHPPNPDRNRQGDERVQREGRGEEGCNDCSDGAHVSWVAVELRRLENHVERKGGKGDYEWEEGDWDDEDGAHPAEDDV